MQQQLMDVDSWANNEPDSWNWRLTPWSAALFKTFPKFIRRELVQVDMGEVGVCLSCVDYYSTAIMFAIFVFFSL